MKTIIEMAREAGFVEYELEDYTQSGYDIRYERFAALVRADEREECAKVCDELQSPPDWNLVAVLWKECRSKLAAAIRARGNT